MRDHKTAPTRRKFLLGLGAFALPAPALARTGTSHSLRMTCPNTGERFAAELIADGEWQSDALKEFSHFARDWRVDRAVQIDRDAIKAAIRLQSLMDSAEPFHLLSAYRTPQTNRRLRGAARNSMHVKAAAFDLRQPDRSNRQLHAAAMSLKAGGVGRYSRFVHIDSGPLRDWRG